MILIFRVHFQQTLPYFNYLEQLTVCGDVPDLDSAYMLFQLKTTGFATLVTHVSTNGIGVTTLGFGQALTNGISYLWSKSNVETKTRKANGERIKVHQQEARYDRAMVDGV